MKVMIPLEVILVLLIKPLLVSFLPAVEIAGICDKFIP